MPKLTTKQIVQIDNLLTRIIEKAQRVEEESDASTYNPALLSMIASDLVDAAAGIAAIIGDAED